MKHAALLTAVLALALSACEKKETIVTPGPGPTAVVPVPGPQGPAGAPGAPGPEGPKGEKGKTGDTVVVVPQPPKSN